MVIVIATILMVAMVNLDYVACVIVATYIYLMLHFCVDYMVTRIWGFYIFNLFENFLITWKLNITYEFNIW